MTPSSITVLAGGTGSIKLLRGLAKVTQDVVIVSNIGDNIWLHGLYVCPDIDTVTYGLAGVLDEKRGWGIKGDTFSFLDQMMKMGQDTWFGLGDKDLATHVCRTEMLKSGKNLTQITATIAKMFGVKLRIIPATDAEVQTLISTPKGKMHLQEFWIRYGSKLKVTDVTFKGAELARPSSNVLKAIRSSDVVIVAPANPVSSIGPILAIARIRRELERVKQKVIAVSPIIGKQPVSGPAAKYMRALGLQVSPVGVATYYRDVVGTMVIAKTDLEMAKQIKQLGIKVTATDIMMRDSADEIRLARYLVGKKWN